MFEELKEVNRRPKVFETYTAEALWTDEHTSKQMLQYHLDPETPLGSNVPGLIDQAVDWLVNKFSITSQTSIADFGCGPGLYAQRLAEKGARVTGIDFSQRSIAYAREKADASGLTIEYVHQNYLQYATEKRFDLILMIYCDFGVLNPSQRAGLLNKFSALLKPGGAIVLDVLSMAAYAQREEAASYEKNSLYGFWSPNEYYGFLNTFKYDEEKVVLDKHSLFEKDRAWTVYNWFQHFSKAELAAAFGKSGLNIEDYYADVAGTPWDENSPTIAVVARKG